MLEDDRLLVVEYGGAQIAQGRDTAEKRAVGELWERKSEGKGVFVLAEKSVGGKDQSRSMPTGQWSDPGTSGQMNASDTHLYALGEAST